MAIRLDYKINFIRGFKMSFTQISLIFNEIYKSNELTSFKELFQKTSYNESKLKVLLSYLVEFGYIEKKSYAQTKYGNTVYKYDRHLENIGTLWIIHFFLASKRHLVIWNRLFNYILTDQYSLKDNMLIYFEDLKNTLAQYTYDRNIGKELKMVMDIYLEERLSNIDILEMNEHGYIINRNQDVPVLIFLVACVYFRDQYFPGATAISVKDVCYAENSPGRLFFLDELIIRKKLELLKYQGFINLESRADLDQIRIGNDLTFEDILEKYYISC